MTPQQRRYIERGARQSWLPERVARYVGLPAETVEALYIEIEHRRDQARRMRERAAHDRFLAALRRGGRPR